MAYVKVRYNKNAESTIKYCFREKGPDDPVHYEHCLPGDTGAANSFATTRDNHNVTEGIQAIQVIQSWGEAESKKLSAEQINKMGQELAARYFEGHQYLVVTHTNDDHHHNHIIVNPIHPETGKRITNKKKHLYKLRELSDQICRENGLSVIDGDAKQRRERMPDRADKIERFNGNSYVYAMKDYARFARHYATSFDEYAGYLDALGVSLRIKEKSITYFYEDKKKGKRGDKLGREFTKDGLEEAFKRNHDLFSRRPELRARIRDEFERISGVGGNPVGASGGVLLDERGSALGQGGDHKAYTKSIRATGDRSRPGDDKLRNSIIPIEAVRRARDANLVEYCVRNKIGLTTNEYGNRALKDRDHVEIGEKTWSNRRNKTKGTALEFAAIHDNTSFVRAMAKINGMPSLVELENVFGPAERKFRSFHVPRRTEARYDRAVERLGRFLNSFGVDPKAAKPLYQGGGVEVRKSGVIRFFAKDDYRNALEFNEEQDGTWSKRRRGKITRPFYSSRGSADRMVIFADPKQYVQKRGKDLFAARERNDSILVLLQPDEGVVAEHLKTNPQIKHVEIVAKGPNKPDQGELDFFGNLKSKLKGLGVNVRLTGYEKALTRRGPDVDLGGF